MPLSFVLAIIFTAIGLIIMGLVRVGYKGPASPRDEAPSRRSVLAVLGVFFGLLVGLLIFSASATNIPTRTVGVEVSLGKPLPTPLKNGFHMVAPWHTVEKFDTSAQFPKREGDKAVTVRLGNQTTAQVDVRQNQWNIDPDGDVIALYRTYKSFDRVSSTVIDGASQSALTEAFQSFDPLAGIAAATGGAPKDNASPSGPTVDQVSATALAACGESWVRESTWPISRSSCTTIR